MGDVFCNIGVREPQKTASEAFCQFGEYHRMMEKYGIKMLKATKPVRFRNYAVILLQSNQNHEKHLVFYRRYCTIWAPSCKRPSQTPS